MAFQVSPGVQVREVDLTNIVPAVASTSGGHAGFFKWGPVEEVTTIKDVAELIEYFGQPGKTQEEAESFFVAESFLKYGSSLRNVRVLTTGLVSANSGGAVASIIKNEEDYEETWENGSQAATVGNWTARYAGALGNSLGVSICASSSAYKLSNATDVDAVSGIDRGSVDIILTDASSFSANDIIVFANHTTRYRVISVGVSEDLLIEQIGAPAGTGLSTSVPDATQVTRYWQFFDLFTKAPGKSASAVANGGSDDEIHIVVYDTDGGITGTKNSILEKYEALSMASDAKDSSGATNFYKKVIQRRSEWIWWTGHDASLQAAAGTDHTHAFSTTTPFLRPLVTVNDSLSDGADGNIPTSGQIFGSWDTHFSDENVDISFLIAGSTRTDDGAGTKQDLRTEWTSIINEGIRICEVRRDCLLIASPRYTDVVGVTESLATLNVIDTANTATSSSYVVFDSTWVYQYDRYNDRYVWVPACAHTAGIMARTDLQRDPWYSPAGLNRGQYLGTVKLAYNPGQLSRDDLYRSRVNPVVSFPGQGTILYGDKTGLTVPSAFDRINVRRLFIVLEKAVAIAAKAQLFEFNDAFTRAQFRSAVEPFLRDVKNRRGLVDFAVVCDDTNNTDSVIDRNEFVCSIFVKPARSINFITLNFVAARSGVDFEEIYSAV